MCSDDLRPLQLAIDQKLASRISYPFLWGTIVLTLIWPTVSYFIRGLAYMFGNVAMALGDSSPAYVWNEATLQAFRNVSSQPVYTVAFACFTMTVAALCLWLSPVIAYQISTGRIYEGVSNAASTFAGAVIGAAVELYSSISATRLNQEAAQIQANAGYESSTTIAGGERRAADLGVKGRQIASEASIEGNRFAQLASAYGHQKMQTGSILADKNYQIAANNQQRDFAIGNQLTTSAREQEENRINYGQQYWNLAGEAVGITAGAVGGIFKGIPVAGHAVDSAVGGIGNLGKNVIQLGAAEDAFKQRETNINTFTDGMNQSQEAFATQMNVISEQRASAQIGAVNASTTQIVGGVNRSADMQLTGVRQEADMGLQGNLARYDAQTQAAEITRGASIETSRLHAMESLIRTIGGKIARDIEGGIVLRY